MIIASAASCCDGFLSRVKERCADRQRDLPVPTWSLSRVDKMNSRCAGEKELGIWEMLINHSWRGEKEGIVKLSKCSRQVGGLNAS